MDLSHQNIEAIQMQIVRLIAGITDESYLIGIREGLMQNRAASSAEMSLLEKEWFTRALGDVAGGRLHANEDVQAEMRAKLN